MGIKQVTGERMVVDWCLWDGSRAVQWRTVHILYRVAVPVYNGNHGFDISVAAVGDPKGKDNTQRSCNKDDDNNDDNKGGSSGRRWNGGISN